MMDENLQEEIKNMTLRNLASLYAKESDPHRKLKVQHALLHATKKKALEKGKTQ